jgi:hypothetical protein
LAFVYVLLLLVLLVLLLLLPHPIMMNDVEDGLAQVHGVNNRVGHARLTKTGILEQGIRQLQIARPRPTGAVQQPAQILR